VKQFTFSQKWSQDFLEKNNSCTVSPKENSGEDLDERDFAGINKPLPYERMWGWRP